MKKQSFTFLYLFLITAIMYFETTAYFLVLSNDIFGRIFSFLTNVYFFLRTKSMNYINNVYFKMFMNTMKLLKNISAYDIFIIKCTKIFP